MMARARQGDIAGIAGIAVVAVDRYTRQVVIGEELIALAKDVDVKIGGGRVGILDLTTYEGITQMRGFVNQAETESLSTSFRLQEKLLGQAKKGKPVGGAARSGSVSSKLVNVTLATRAVAQVIPDTPTTLPVDRASHPKS
jgi:hypothetical protein